jgi:patatin-like phospholipase/acyl hydrolase
MQGVSTTITHFTSKLKQTLDSLVMSALASVVDDANTAVHLRNYDIGPTVPSEYTGWSIWEAARATSAAPIYFKRFTKDGKEFVDGGLGWNNPTYE